MGSALCHGQVNMLLQYLLLHLPKSIRFASRPLLLFSTHDILTFLPTRPTASSVDIPSFTPHLAVPWENVGAARLRTKSDGAKALQTILDENASTLHFLRRCDTVYRPSSGHSEPEYTCFSSFELDIKWHHTPGAFSARCRVLGQAR